MLSVVSCQFGAFIFAALREAVGCGWMGCAVVDGGGALRGVLPPHPRPLSPVSRGRGEICRRAADGSPRVRRRLSCISVSCGLWLFVEVCCPLTPDPSPPFHGGEGRICRRAADGSPRVRRRLRCISVSCGLWLCVGMCCPLTPDPSPPAGARGGFCVFVAV